MKDLERFVDECRRAAAQPAVREILEEAVSEPGRVLAMLGEPERAGVYKLYVGDDLTILNVIWGPRMTIMPHNHEMWALIGIYTGREDNIFWKRANGRIKAAGARALGVRDVATLGRDIIHSVTNPIDRLTGAIHIYGGQFFNQARSEWDPETLEEGAYSVEKTMRLFEESNRR